MSVAVTPERNMPVLRYFDVILLVVAAPILLLIGVSATGYLIGTGAWIVLRVIGIGVEHVAGRTNDAGREIGLRLGFMLGRLFALAIVVILVRKSAGQGAGLAALVVVVAAFTIAMGLSAATRPRRTR